MGLWSGHEFWPLEPFIASLRGIRFAGDVCIFVADVSPATVEKLRELGIIVERATLSGQPRMTVLSSRFFTYLDYLAAHVDDYAHVMLTDLRDVVFQSDPFAAPLPASIVFAQERTRIADSPVNQAWLVQAYGETVAANMSDCLVACAGTTFGTTAGMLRYLTAITRELSSRPPPIVGGIDQGVHNFVVHMVPLTDAWLDTSDSVVATMHFVPEAAVHVSALGVTVDGKPVPVMHQWDRNPRTKAHVETMPQFRLTDAPAKNVPVISARDAVVAFHQHERGAAWLEDFLGSLRCVGFTGPVHCIGTFDTDALQLLSRFRATPYNVATTEPALAENIAHFYLSQLLDRLATVAAPPDQVLVLATTSAVFARDPFQNKTFGLSMFSEGPVRMGESDYNIQRLGLFVLPDAERLRAPIVSSVLLRGPLDVVRDFYHRLLVEFAGRDHLIGIQKSIQGAVNKLCHDGGLGYPITVHPNAAEAWLDFWPSGLAIDTRQGVRVGGAMPAVVFGASRECAVVRATLISLGLLPG